MTQDLNPDIPTTEPTPTHPERNESMKTENTANENVETLTTEEASVPATVEATESIADVEEVQPDDYDPNDPLFGDNSPTRSAHKPVSWFKKAGIIGGLLLTVVGFLCAFTLSQAVGSYLDARWETDCIQGQRMEARIPSDFDGNLRAYVAAGNKVTELGPCDNISWQR